MTYSVPVRTAELRSDFQLFPQACSVRCQRFEVAHVKTLVPSLQNEQLLSEKKKHGVCIFFPPCPDPVIRTRQSLAPETKERIPLSHAHTKEVSNCIVNLVQLENSQESWMRYRVESLFVVHPGGQKVPTLASNKLARNRVNEKELLYTATTS